MKDSGVVSTPPPHVKARKVSDACHVFSALFRDDKIFELVEAFVKVLQRRQKVVSGFKDWFKYTVIE
jgi:hypothetical protein